MSVFAGKVIVLTGASEGIGRAFALALAGQRPKLVLAARNRDRLESLAAECRARGAEAHVVPTDVTDANACKARTSPWPAAARSTSSSTMRAARCGRASTKSRTCRSSSA